MSYGQKSLINFSFNSNPYSQPRVSAAIGSGGGQGAARHSDGADRDPWNSDGGHRDAWNSWGSDGGWGDAAWYLCEN